MGQRPRRGCRDRPLQRLAGRRSDPQGEAGLCGHAARRTSTTRPGRTRTRACRHRRSSGRSSSTTSRGTAGTTSATRARRPLRDGVRGGMGASTGTSSAPTREASTSARSGSPSWGLSHDRTAGRSRRRAREGTRLAARRRARRRALDLQRDLLRQRALRSGDPRLPARRLRPPRHGLTTCPGERLFTQLPAIARRVAALGLPKLYPLGDARAAGRHSAHCSTVVRASLDGVGDRRRRRRAGPGRGTGAAVDWTWAPGTPIPAGARWRIESPGATPAEGASSPPLRLPLRLAEAKALPATISPNGDGQSDATTVSFTLSADANVTVSG